MVKKWMLNGIASLACLWLIYVFLHWTQLRVWARLHKPIVLNFRYSVRTNIPENSTIRADEARKNAATFEELTAVNMKEYDSGVPKCKLSNLGFVMTPVKVADLTPLRSRAQPLSRGVWQPSSCRPEQRLAVLIPYRNRSDNLALVTNHLNFFMQQQLAQYGLFVVEQADKRLFNRAKLFNVGVKLVRKMYPDFDCFIFHDADKLPMNTHHIYRCSGRPRHMIATMRTSHSKKFINGKLYSNFFGGVTALTWKMYEKVNGMSNNYWGWGREDDDMSARLRLRGMSLEYTRNQVAQYLNIAHKHDIIVNKNPWPYMQFVRRTMNKDGLNNANFSIVSITHTPAYTNFKVIL